MPTGQGPWMRVAAGVTVTSTAARASTSAAFSRSRRSWLAASRASAWRFASSAVVASRSRAASTASPTRPAAFSRGAMANDTVSRSTAAAATFARSRIAAIPGRGATRRMARPRRAMARFSPTIGATSATVPIVARSASARAAAGPPGRSFSSAPAILKATPLPASRRSGYRESGRCGSTTARAAGMTGGTRWWSVTMTSSPRRPASAISAWLVAPQSTVMMTVAPTACARSRAAIERPWPSSSRLGTYGSTARP